MKSTHDFWKDDEIEQLKTMAANGYSQKQISEAIGRSCNSIQRKSKAIGLRFGYIRKKKVGKQSSSLMLTETNNYKFLQDLHRERATMFFIKLNGMK